MLTFNGNLKVYVALQPCDMRKSFNGLSEIARNQLKVEPTSGAAFLFTNRRRNLIKICLLYTSPSPRDGLLSRMPSSA